MADLDCDVAVIGAGTAGLAAEHHARKAGARTLLVDPVFAGTTCATVGCMPSKLLIAAADAAWSIRHAVEFGISAEPEIDASAVFARLRKERDSFVEGVQQTIARIPDEARIRARASFSGPDRLQLDDGRSVSARAIVIATGARPVIPDAFRHVEACLLTNESLFDLSSLPKSVAVIGAGPLGLELGQALARLGSWVEVFDREDTVGGLSDKRVSETLCACLRGEMPLHLGVEPEVSPGPKGVRLSWEGESRDFETLLVAAGRVPNLGGLNLPASRIGCDGDGLPLFDSETLQCGDSPIFIAGDANGDRPVLHEAAHEGTIAGKNAARFPDTERFTRHVPLAITFTRPEAAVIGRVADPEEDDVTSAEAHFDDQGRARVEARSGGLCRIYARRSDGRLTGASLCTPDGSHLAHLIAWAIEAEMTIADVLDRPLYHPTLEEGLKPAFRALCAETGTRSDPSRRDDSPCA